MSPTRPLLLLLLLQLLFTAPSGTSRIPPSATSSPCHESEATIVILAGQSNMAGRGGVSNGTWDGVVQQECRPSPRILRLSARLKWEVAQEPLHSDIDVNKTNGVGPGMPFAHGILHQRLHTGKEEAVGVVGLVPCAIGGTGIDQWLKGTELYEGMIRRARAALGGEVLRGEIGAVLWYQGESDTANQSYAESYKGKMERLIMDWRADLGLPDLLVIQVALASGIGPYLDVVRQAQNSIKLHNVLTVDAVGLQLDALQLHLTTPAQIHLGNMMAAAYLQHRRAITKS